jgi:hypothetical protein
MSVDGSLTSGGTAFYDAMAKKTQTYSSSTEVYFESPSPNLKYAYFAFPAGYNDLISVIDNNNFEQITNFSKTTSNVSSTGLTNN